MIDKPSLRKKINEYRKSINADIKTEKDSVIADKLKQNDAYIKAKTVLIYVSRDIEVDTKVIISEALSSGKTVAVPRCEGDDNIMNYYVIKSFDDLEKGKFGLSEPKKYCKKAIINEPCLCVVPALAVDEHAFRLGFGKGYYDRFLSENRVESVCICYSENKLKELPTDRFDIPVDIVITD